MYREIGSRERDRMGERGRNGEREGEKGRERKDPGGKMLQGEEK